MTPKRIDEEKIEKEVEKEEMDRRKKDEIGTEAGVYGAEIVEEMEQAYIDYAMSVIVQRALPSVEDGLKPVHRRILYAMHSIGLDSSKPTKKSAAVVGEVLGKYHPHGDISVYDALVRMAQNFSLRYPLVHGQGNFGSVDGDSAAAMRYCVSGDSLIVSDKGLVRIDQLSEKENINMKILSKEKKINTASKWFDSGIHDSIKITTDKGFSLSGSLNHPVLILSKDQFGKPAFFWKLLANIEEGDVVVLDRLEDDFWPKNQLNLKKFVPVLRKRMNKRILPNFMNEDLAFILGAFVSEGYIGKNKIEFCNSDMNWIEEFEKRWNNLFPDSKLHRFDKSPSSYGKLPYSRLECHCRYTLEFLRNIGLKNVKSGLKNVPEVILQSPKEVVKKFISSYFEGDGSISASSRMIELSCCSKSEEMMNAFQILLLRFGIDATKRFDKHKNIHKLYLRGKRNVLRFYKEIGFISKRKKRKLETVILAYQKESFLKDYVPFISDYVRNLADSSFISKNNFDRYPNMQKNYQKVSQILLEKTGVSYEEMFEHFLTYSYLFDKVVKIEDAGKQKVYSIKVDSDCHSFISNGFISHNTEAKLSKYSAELLEDIGKETVKMTPNFDNSIMEPDTLPGKLPNLLLMGATGIAVGMATNIPPHNLREICDAIIGYIEKPEIEIEELAKIVKGPDFPTGGYAMGSGILDMYKTGKGKVIMRGRTNIEDIKGKQKIIITEIPYMVNKSNLVKEIAKLATEKRLPDVSDLRDESAKGKMRVVIELKKGVDPKYTLNKLYKLTRLQSNFDANLLALVGKQPRVLNLKNIIEEYVKYRKLIVTKRSEFELRKAEDRLEIVLGLLIALENIDKIIDFIKKSKDASEAHSGLMTNFKLSDRQAKAVLETKLQQLTRLEDGKLREEEKKLKETIGYLKKVLGNINEILRIIKKEVNDLNKNYGDDRRTRIIKKVDEVSETDLIEKKDVVVMLTESGYIKRVDMKTYREQRRGGSGVIGTGLKDEDFVRDMVTCSTHDYLLFFTSRGRVYWLKANDVPSAERTGKGRSVANLLQLRDEEIANVMSVKDFNSGYLMFATKLGIVKKLPLKDVSKPRNTGVRIMNLPADGTDVIINVAMVNDKQEVLLVSKKGQAVRFNSDNVRAMGRASYGVKGIELGRGDEVVALMSVPLKGETTVLTITDKGYGKRSKLEDYRKTARGGKGVINLKISDKTGFVIGSVSVDDKDSIILTTSKGMIIRTSMKGLRVMGRATQGVRVVRLKERDKVADLVKVPVAEVIGEKITDY